MGADGRIRTFGIVQRRRPRQGRFGDPQLDMVWAAWEVLDPGRQHALLREQATELAGKRTDNVADRFRVAIAALRDAADLLGHAPNQSEYRQLRERAPELDLVADGNLRRWLGNRPWNDCLRCAYLDTVSEGDFVSTSQTDAFTEDELVANARDYQAEHDGEVHTLEQLLAWNRTPEVMARPGRRPLSWPPFQRFGGYRTVLVRNGLIDANSPRLDGRGRVLPTSNAYDDEELRAARHMVERRLGREPHAADYRDERLKIVAEFRASGSLETLPTVATLTRRFGPWPNVLRETSSSSEDAAPGQKAPRRRPRYTAEEKLDWLRRAWVEIGQPFSQERYSAWRQEKLEEAVRRREFIEIPSLTAFYGMPGGWAGACQQALPAEAKLWRRGK